MLTKFVVKDFLEDRELKNLSEKTLDAYKLTLNEFHEFAVKHSVVNLEDIDYKLIKQYLTYCKKKRNNSPSTLNHKLKNLRIFFSYASQCEYIEAKNNPAKKVGYAQTDTRIDVFSDLQITQMLRFYSQKKQKSQTFYAFRNYTMIIVLLGTGMRTGELINLKWSDYDVKNQSISVFGKKRSSNSIPIAHKLKKELLEYRLYCEEEFSNLPTYIFTKSNGQPMTEAGTKQVFQELSKVMNFSNVRLSAHTFRHTFSYRYLMAGGDVFSLQKMLRHNTLEMTKRYVNMFGVGLAEQNNKFNPLIKLDI